MNQGHRYEEKIKTLLRKQGLLPVDLGGNDAGFIHQGAAYFVEVKNRTAPDFGQKGLIWSQAGGWEWRVKDVVTDLYDTLGVKKLIDKNFIPNRYAKPTASLTLHDKQYDQTHFEKSGIRLSNLNCLYAYYARKRCFYIQVEGLGMYYLQQDLAELKVSQFAPQLTLRLRAKTHHSNPVHHYSFFAVIQPDPVTTAKSSHDLEGKVAPFPAITK